MMSWSPDVDDHPKAWPWRGKHDAYHPTPKEPATLRCEALAEKFCIDGIRVEVGQVAELPPLDARRLIAIGHAKLI